MWRGSGPGGGGSSGGWTTVMKTANETRNSTTGSADATLTFTAAANTPYVVRGFLRMTTADPAGFYVEVTVPNSRQAVYRVSEPDFDGPGRVVTGGSISGTGVTDIVVTFEVIVLADVGGGAVAVAWGQAVSNAADTTLFKGSYIEYKAVA